MRVLKRPFFVALLAAAFIVGGAGKASFVQIEHAAPVHEDSAHSQHAVHQHGDDQAHHHGGSQDQKQHASFKCCGLCLAVSGDTPIVPCVAVELIASSIFYSLDCKFKAGSIVVLDPGIPKYVA